jgi:signal peptidase I
MNWKFWTKKEKEQPEKKKSAVREWWDAILFAVVAATLIRWLIMEAYTIPTPSMENSMLVGDFLFVSKFHYGTRTPRTPHANAAYASKNLVHQHSIVFRLDSTSLLPFARLYACKTK